MQLNGATIAAMTTLNGFFSLRTPRDLLQKLEADFQRLQEADQSSIVAQYAAFDFFVCAEHLPDWMKGTVGGSLSDHRSFPDGQIVSHIASGAKHFVVKDPRHTVARDTSALSGAFDSAAFSRDAFDVPRLVIELEDGGSAQVLDVAQRVLEHWRRVIGALSA